MFGRDKMSLGSRAVSPQVYLLLPPIPATSSISLLEGLCFMVGVAKGSVDS